MAGADTIRASEKESGDVIDKTPPAFTIDDLLADLRPEDAAEGFTVTEICQQAGLPTTGSNRAKVYRKVKDLEALGLWEPVPKKEVVTVTGAKWREAGAWRPVSLEEGD